MSFRNINTRLIFRKDPVVKLKAFLGFPCQDWKLQDVPPYHGREKFAPSLQGRGAMK